jgi:hypothetical protein
MGSVILLVGTGHLGGPILDRLAATPSVERVVALGRDARRGEARCNLARLTAAAVGEPAHIEHRSVDVADPGRVAATVQDIGPDLVLHTASMQTWWLLDLFPEDARAALKPAGYGVWLPLHLRLAMTLMQGLAEASYEGVVLNAAYPDVINVVLGRIGTPPTGGVGNVDELVAKVRTNAARSLGVAGRDLDVWLVAHHAVQLAAFRAAHSGSDAAGADLTVPPYHLHLELRGEDVTDRARAHEALFIPCELPPGPGWGNFTAASAVALVEAVLAEARSRTHAAAPGGFAGGYPVDVGGGRIDVSAIPGLSRDEAVAINERSHRFDGIDGIGEDGTVVFAEDAATAIRDTLGYDCGMLPPGDVEDRAAELALRFREYATRHGIDLPVDGG